VEGLEVGRKLVRGIFVVGALVSLMKMLDWCCLTAHHRMISREAGLNGMASRCTGVPSMKTIPNTSMAS